MGGTQDPMEKEKVNGPMREDGTAIDMVMRNETPKMNKLRARRTPTKRDQNRQNE